MVRPPAAAIRDLLVFGGSEGLREISRPRWGPEMAVLAVTRRHRGVFGIFLAHRNRVRIAQLSSIDDVGWCLPNFPAICDLLVLGGGQEDQKVDFPGLGFKPGLNHMFLFFWGGVRLGLG